VVAFSVDGALGWLGVDSERMGIGTCFRDRELSFNGDISIFSIAPTHMRLLAPIKERVVLGNMVDGSCSLFGAGFFSELKVMRTDRLACRPLGHPREHPRLQQASSRARVFDLYGFLELLHVPGLNKLFFCSFSVDISALDGVVYSDDI
jgi:hypothetical protein